VAAVGPAARHVFLTPEAQATVPAVSTANVDFKPINEHDDPLGKTRKKLSMVFYPTGRTFPKSEARNPKEDCLVSFGFRASDLGFVSSRLLITDDTRPRLGGGLALDHLPVARRLRHGERALCQGHAALDS